MQLFNVFLMAYLGALTGVMTAILPILYLVKKKLKNYNPMQNMFKGLNDAK